jgi:hypothetical protein
MDLHEEDGREELTVWGLRLDDEEEKRTHVEGDDEGRKQTITLTTAKSTIRGVRVPQKKEQNRFAVLASLEEEQDEAMIMSVTKAEYEGWRRVTATVDSASADHVSPEEEFKGFKMEPSEGSKQGKGYVAANGQKVPNLGQKRTEVMTDDGKKLSVTWQITKVTKPLLSVDRLVEGGNEVSLTRSFPYIKSKDGWLTPLRRKNRMFEVDLWVKDDEGFSRQ